MAIKSIRILPQPPRSASVVAAASLSQRLLVRDPDAAALALDGAICALLVEVAGMAPDASVAPEALLHSLDDGSPELGRRFRLALRAPNVEARLAHLWALIAIVFPNSALGDASHQR